MSLCHVSNKKKDYLVRATLFIQMINKNYYYDIVVESLC